MDSFPFTGLVPQWRSPDYQRRLEEYAGDWMSAAELGTLNRAGAAVLLPGVQYYLHEGALLATTAQPALRSKFSELVYAFTLLDLAIASVSRAREALEQIINDRSGAVADYVDRIKRVCRGLGFGDEQVEDLVEKLRTERRAPTAWTVRKRWEDLAGLEEENAFWTEITTLHEGVAPRAGRYIVDADNGDGRPTPFLDTWVAGLVLRLFWGKFSDSQHSPWLRLALADMDPKVEASLRVSAASAEERTRARMIRDEVLRGNDVDERGPNAELVTSTTKILYRKLKTVPGVGKGKPTVFSAESGLRGADGKLAREREMGILSRECADILGEAVRQIAIAESSAGTGGGGQAAGNGFLTGRTPGANFALRTETATLPRPSPLGLPDFAERADAAGTRALLARGGAPATDEGVVQKDAAAAEHADALLEDRPYIGVGGDGGGDNVVPVRLP